MFVGPWGPLFYLALSVSLFLNWSKFLLPNWGSNFFHWPNLYQKYFRDSSGSFLFLESAKCSCIRKWNKLVLREPSGSFHRTHFCGNYYSKYLEIYMHNILLSPLDHSVDLIFYCRTYFTMRLIGPVVSKITLIVLEKTVLNYCDSFLQVLKSN